MLEDIKHEVRIVTLRRQPMNTLDINAIERLSEFFENHPPEMPLVLDGSEGVFSAGVDSKQFMGYDHAQRHHLARAITRMTAKILSIPAPVVASIPGHLEAKAGIAFPDGPAELVQSELPPTLLRQLTLTSQTMSAADLLRHGVFDESDHPDRLTELAIVRARTLAEQPGFRAVKAQMRGALAARVNQLAQAGRESAFC